MNKIIAPVIIAVLFIAYFMILLAGFTMNISINPISLLGIVIFIYLIMVMLKVTKERIDEIRNGENDDISKY